MEAGQLEGEQYILPLSISVPLFVGGKDSVEKSGFDAEAAAANQTAFFDELSRALNESGAQILYTLSLTNLLQQPLIDYAAGRYTWIPSRSASAGNGKGLCHEPAQLF